MKQDHRNFFILGCGGSGTSLLRGLLNAHTYIMCQFEFIQKSRAWSENMTKWTADAREANASGFVFGNKIPFEQFLTALFPLEDMVSIIDKFYVIFLQRRFSKYYKPRVKYPVEKWKKETRGKWEMARDYYDLMREEKPEKILFLSFEELVTDAKRELKRICDFLKVDYDDQMLSGTAHTGHAKYDQAGINKTKI